MDVSIAVSLFQGQMRSVVERAVNGAVETVLAEMLKVVGVKFEELKTQLALMKRDVTAMQREKALKEKENDNIRAKLRYTELKLKYYRQGVEEELQQRASASTLVRIHPSSFPQTQRDAAGLSPTDTSPSCSTQIRTTEGALMRCNQEQDAVESLNDCLAPPTVQTVTLALGKKSATGPLSPHGSIQAACSSLPFSAPQVKQEALQQQGEEEGVICIKEEPKEEQQVMATSGLDYQTQSSVTEVQPSQATPTTAYSSAQTSNYPMLRPIASLPSLVTLTPGVPPLQETRPWTKNLNFYEQYKLRRNELQQRRLNRRREQEETLPQPLLADMLRERREKTRLRVARWRAKRKLQFCLNQTQVSEELTRRCFCYIHVDDLLILFSSSLIGSRWRCRSFSTWWSHPEQTPGGQRTLCFLRWSPQTASVQRLPGQQHVRDEHRHHRAALHNLHFLLFAAPWKLHHGCTPAHCDINVLILVLPSDQPELLSDRRRYLTVRSQLWCSTEVRA